MLTVAASFAQFLIEYRDARNLVQEKLASLLDVDRNTIRLWEAGKSLPKRPDVPEYAARMGVSVADMEAAIVASMGTRPPTQVQCVTGNYQLFQWSYFNDQRIMRTNLRVLPGGKNRRVRFEEEVVTATQSATIRGTVKLVHTNMFFYGQCDDLFREREVIIVNMPRMNEEWLMGVVAGVSSDRSLHPSASRVVMHYTADKTHISKPQYEQLDNLELSEEFKDYLRGVPDQAHPILSSR